MADPVESQVVIGEGLLSNLSSINALIFGGLMVAIFIANFLLTPRLDSSEPPLLKPSVPFIGHVVGIIWHQNDYHRIVHKKHPIPIASLQMLWGKIYTIWDPQLAQASLRARTLSFDPFIVEFAQKSFGLSEETFAKITSNPRLVPDFTEAIHASMQPKYLHAMNVIALNYISRTLDEVSPGEGAGLDVPNLYLWIRDLITSATTEALLGNESPFSKDPTLYDDLWNFEQGLPDLLMKPFPSITARKAYLARNRLQDALGDYYAAENDLNDPTAAQLTRGRANVMRSFGFTGNEVAKVEVMLPVVGTTNSAPTMYWMICKVFANPDLVDRLRLEAMPLLEKGRDASTHEVVINIARLDVECPLLVSCYREILRMVNHNVSMRRIMEDTTIKDGEGRAYLLKKGVDVQIAGGVMHKIQGVWGDDAQEFNPERFLAATDKSADQINRDKTKKNAYIPFGGGRHLCPGRNFAFAELLGLTCALVVGFDLTSVGLDFDQMKPRPAVLANAIVKPMNDGEGLGLKLRRRKGWENVKWRFES